MPVRIGELLLKEKRITPAQLQEALNYQKTSGGKLGFNLVKLGFERRQKVIGARFKTKLVLAFLLLSVTPAALIFLIASNFINKSIEGWFKPQVERPLDQALAVAQTYYNQLERTGVRHAQHIAQEDAQQLAAPEAREVHRGRHALAQKRG